MLNSNNIKKIFNINLKKLRTSKNLTQEQLAKILNMQMQSITFIETGNIEPTQKELNLKQDISRLLSSCDYDKLLSIYNIIIALQK